MKTTIEKNLKTSLPALANETAQMTDEDFSLFIQIANMIIGNQARRQYVMSYTGKMKDLPAILETI